MNYGMRFSPQPEGSSVIDPYVVFSRIDRQMRYAANDPERFTELCIRREVIVGAMEAIATSVQRFLVGGGLGA